MSETDVAPLLVRPDGLVPKERYTSRAFVDLEMEGLWSRVWQVACREEEIANPGDFLEYTIGDQSILVVRGDDAAIRAFSNHCLHRGTRLASGTGNFGDGQIRCRYHAWQYALDGELVEVVDRHEFTDLPDGLRLGELRAETWGGFVFVNADPDAEPLLDFLHPIPKLLDRYHLEQMRFRGYLTTIMPANWKVVVDAFNEGYHVQGTHPQLLAWTDDVSIEYEQFETHARYGRLEGARRALTPSPRLGLRDDEIDGGAILSGLVEGLGGAFLKEERALVEELRASTPPDRLLAEFQRRRKQLLAARGLDVSELGDELMTSADDVYWFPNLVGPIYPGSAILFRVRPNGLDPDSSIKDTWVLEWPAPDREPRPLNRKFFADWHEHDWGVITTQDYDNMLEVQTGMKSRAFDGLRLNPRQEGNVAHMHRVIDRYLCMP
jgi:nitrite reductase/ring-hydroxylating ferredoxin subunit